jgi:hypothetical protein
MRRAYFLAIFLSLLCGYLKPAQAQMDVNSTLSAEAGGEDHGQTIDGIAARIEDDILTDSEVNELSAFQSVVDGRSKPRSEVIQELADQWVVRGEAATTRYPQPTDRDIDAAYAQLQSQFPSPDAFKSRCAAAGLSQPAVRRLLAQQLYLARFLDFRFRPAAQVNDDQVTAYYKNEFVPQLQKRGEPVPAIEDVEDTIREVLVQRAISARATEWLDDTRMRLRLEVIGETQTAEKGERKDQ